MNASIVYNRAVFNREIERRTEILICPCPFLYGVVVYSGDEGAQRTLFYTYRWNELSYGGFSYFLFSFMTKKQVVEFLREVFEGIKITDTWSKRRNINAGR